MHRIVADGGDWASYGNGLANHRSQPAEDTIRPENVDQLTLKMDDGEYGVYRLPQES